MISIAMATYNGEKYLEEQLCSIEAQSVQPDELVVCDDCSTDKTIEILNVFKKRVSFDVKILQNTTNGGYAKNFARVIEATTGDFVFMCDQDDYWFPNKIEKVLAAFKDNPKAQLVAHNAMCTDANLKPVGMSLFDFDDIRGLRRGSIINGFVTCCRRSYLNYVLPIPYCFTFDRWLSLPASTLNNRYEMDEILAYYRRHENAVTFEQIGKEQNFINIAKRKIRSNIRSLKRARSMEEIDYRYTRESSIIQFANKIKADESFPEWVDKNLLEEMVAKAEVKIEAFKARYEAISFCGFKRIQKVLSAYKKGVYKNFHGFKTALDDIFRITKGIKGTPETRFIVL